MHAGLKAHVVYKLLLRQILESFSKISDVKNCRKSCSLSCAANAKLAT